MSENKEDKMIVAIYGHRHQEAYLDSIRELLEEFARRGDTLAVRRRFYDYLVAIGVQLPAQAVCVDDICEAGRPDVALSIGGDGTLLRTAKWVGESGVPVLGINTGHLGFLANSRLEGDGREIVEEVHNHRLVREPRMLLEVVSDRLPEDVWPYALNEVAVLKEDTSSMISVHTLIDDLFLADYLADGLLVGTPTGSTGYNLSAGGPILEPTAEGIVLSPVAPHSLTLRPIVVRSDREVTLTTDSRAGSFRVSLDGRSFVATAGTTLKIRRAKFTLNILRRPTDDFAATLRHKLLWGRR